MKYLYVMISLAAVGWAASTACGQYGLYGSPEMVRFPQVPASPGPYYAYPGAAGGVYPGYPAVAAPASYPTAAPTVPQSIISTSYQAEADLRPLPSTYSAPQANPYVAQAQAAPALMAPAPGGVPPMPSPSPSDLPMMNTPALPPAPAQTPPVINQMLQESGWSGGGYYGVPAPAPRAPMGPASPTPFGEAACDSWADGCDAPVVTGFGPQQWYVTARGLMMTRNKANPLKTTVETNDELVTISTEADWDWSGGGEIRIGRWFGMPGCGLGECVECGPTWGVEAAYWSLTAFSDSVVVSRPGGVSTPLDVLGISFDGITGCDYFDAAQMHRIRRGSELHSGEINLVFGQPYSPGPLNVTGFVGARYFRFADDLNFSSLEMGWNWGDEGGLHEAYLRDRITNDLIGAHVGVNASYLLGFNLRIFFNPSIGIYNNHLENQFHLYRGDGTAAIPLWPPNNPTTYPIESSHDIVAFMSQVDLGVEWQFGMGWSANIGYRVLFATGIGLADHQVPSYYLTDGPQIAQIDTNGDLILHGAFAGLTLRF